MAQNVAGTALVFEAPMSRFMLTSILLMARVPIPFSCHARLEGAEAWVRQQLRVRFGIAGDQRAA